MFIVYLTFISGVRESIEAQERGWIATIKNTIIRIFRFVGKGT